MRFLLSRRSLVATLLAGVFALSTSFAFNRAPAAPPVAQPAAPAAETQAVFRGRLPAHFSKVVSPEQRDKIYEIQKVYEPKIDALVEQLADIRLKRMDEMEAVLTPDQLEKIVAMREEVRARRAAARATPGEAEQSTKAPATPAATSRAQ